MSMAAALTTKGDACSFPFTYDGMSFATCIFDGTGDYGEFGWCALDPVFESGRWGVCAHPPTDPATRVYVSTFSSDVAWLVGSSSFYGSEHVLRLGLTADLDAELPALFEALGKVKPDGGTHPAHALRAALETIGASGSGRRSLVVLVTDDEFGGGAGTAVASVRPQIKADSMERGEDLKASATTPH